MLSVELAFLVKFALDPAARWHLNPGKIRIDGLLDGGESLSRIAV
jgi:hypothetical protein